MNQAAGAATLQAKWGAVQSATCKTTGRTTSQTTTQTKRRTTWKATNQTTYPTTGGYPPSGHNHEANPPKHCHFSHMLGLRKTLASFSLRVDSSVYP